jgi:hypothetical protein
MKTSARFGAATADFAPPEPAKRPPDDQTTRRSTGRNSDEKKE